VLSNPRKGFTLIEVIIVVGITAVLAGMILTYTSASRDQVALYVEQAKLAQSISRTKSLAITTFNRPPGDGPVPCAYGIHMDYDAQTYTIFSYAAPRCAITAADLAQIGEEDCSQTSACVVSTEHLPLNVRLVADDAAAVSDILFVPPDPKTWIWKQGFNATSTEGQVSLEATQATVVIRINQAGQITF
jgi:prepilin-type N-terminal cleavage/methylation domain-containing protein